MRIETGKILQRARKLKQLSLTEAAQLLEMSPFYVKALEEGSTLQPLCDVYRLAEFYGHCLAELRELSYTLMEAKAMRELKAQKGCIFHSSRTTQNRGPSLPPHLQTFGVAGPKRTICLSLRQPRSGSRRQNAS